MLDIYSARYSDATGDVETTIANNGATLRMVVRGVEFAGGSFDSLRPPEEADRQLLDGFRFHRGALCSFGLQWEMPIPVVSGEVLRPAVLSCALRMGDSAPHGGIEHFDLHLTLRWDDKEFRSPGTHGWFEEELLAIQAELPEGVYMKACLNCRLARYSPYCHGLLGSMLCFRDLKDREIDISLEAENLPLSNHSERLVQETYLCPEFERQIHGAGY